MKHGEVSSTVSATVFFIALRPRKPRCCILLIAADLSAFSLVSGPGPSSSVLQPLLLTHLMYPTRLKIDKLLIAVKCSVVKYTSLLIK